MPHNSAFVLIDKMSGNGRVRSIKPFIGCLDGVFIGLKKGVFLGINKTRIEKEIPKCVHVDLTAADVEKWQGQINTVRFDFSRLPDPYTVEIDWIRPEGLFIGNESFEYWDMINDRIRDWDLVGDQAKFNL